MAEASKQEYRNPACEYVSDPLNRLGTGSTLVSCTPTAARLSFGARMMAVQRSLMMPTFCGTCSASACRATADSSHNLSPCQS